ncbi:MAG: bifunctional riboflavin kinase/FAD synthetase [Campylobacterales bacterium]|nr:bifunctional riboflavin kinase/FAD synthetase [Campylobacterales bacterium]
MIRSIALGAFDGIHLAHKELIQRVEGVAIIERGNGKLTPGFVRQQYIAKPTFFYHFEKIKELSAKEFVEMLKVDFPNLEKIVVGYDFYFGKNKEGGAKLLQELFHQGVDVIDEIMLDGISIHSRVIKEALSAGDITLANRLLGREYKILGDIIKGQGIGKEKLVPTINLDVKEYILPKEGVYTSYTHIDGEVYRSVSFVGHRESTDGSFAVETHILDEAIEPKCSKIAIEFIDLIRDNKKFDDLDALKKQIDIDIKTARQQHEG